MHEPVLLREVLDLLEPKVGGTYVDGTVGSGGHSVELLRRIGSSGRLLGIDRDAAALARTRRRLDGCAALWTLAHGNFADMAEIVNAQGIAQVDGILLDLGVSSEQLEDAARGFSFMHSGALDMRMDGSTGETATELVARLEEDALRDLLRDAGGERRAGRVARAIVRERERASIETTERLADIVSRAVGGRRGRIHPATRTFQALRMAVNEERASLERGLGAALGLLGVGGRVAVIAFHSLDDGMVKKCFKRHAGRWESLPGGGRELQRMDPPVALVTRKPVTPGPDELARNPRARSAKLRVAVRIEGTDRADSLGRDAA